MLKQENRILPWYHSTTIYQLYPRSFFDSNKDGIGDIPGIIQKLDYIRDVGFETIWLSPFFQSPQQDFGYDISDFHTVAYEYGTMEDVHHLIEEIHSRKMRIVLDMVLNHTSIEHPWFIESASSRNNEKSDWYLWKDKPNNWKSMTGGSGWHYVEERDQYYYASFLPFQPDLNYRNPEVKKAMLAVVHFWLGKGVDGFRLDIFNVIYKDAKFRANPFSFNLLPGETRSSGFFQHFKYNHNQPEALEFAKELRRICGYYGEKMLLGEVIGTADDKLKFLGGQAESLTQVFNFEMLRFKFSAKWFYQLIREIEKKFPYPFMPCYVFSNHDRSRSMYRLKGDVKKAQLLYLLQLTARGVPCVYYGEEIGMVNGEISGEKIQDPLARKYRFVPKTFLSWAGETLNRDEVRTPMQWNDSGNAGFSESKITWLPVHKNFKEVNVERQLQSPDSLLHHFKSLLKLRKENPALNCGDLVLIRPELLKKNVLVFRRKFEDDELIVVLNFSEIEVRLEEFRDTKILFSTGHPEPGAIIGLSGVILVGT